MKKIFLLIPVLVLALVTNAANVISITPTSPEPADNLRLALNNANDGDEIVMAAGTYVESPENYIAFISKNVIVRAAEGAEVVLVPQVPITISGGSVAEFRNIQIDASELCSVNSYSHLIYPTDAVGGNSLILDGCEIYGYEAGKAVIAARSTNVLESVIINNCKFYNHTTRSCVFLENTDNQELRVTNSTFYNIVTGTADFSAGVIDNRSTTAEVRVDHCTFYNCFAKNTDYGAIKVPTTTDVSVSNCIFMMSESYSGGRAVYNTGGTVDNCLTYNYTKDSAPCHGIHSGPTITNCFEANPLFADAANGDFSFNKTSPAYFAGTNWSHLGDPRWFPVEPVGIDLPATSADAAVTLDNANIEAKYSAVAFDGDGYYDMTYASDIRWTAWIVNINPLVYDISAFVSCNTGWHPDLYLFNLTTGAEIASRIEEYHSPTEGASFELGEWDLTSVEAGKYLLVVKNNYSGSNLKMKSLTLSYYGGAVQNMPGTTNINDAWFSAEGTRDGGMIDFPDGHIQDGWVKWNVSFASAANYNVTLNVNSDNCKNYTVALVDANDANVVTPLTLNDCDTKGTAVALSMGAMEVPAGNYILKVTNATENSDAQLLSVQFAYAGGGLVDIPGDISFSEVILSSRAFIDENGEIRFTTDAEHSHVTEESVKWRVNVSKEGNYKFTTSVNSTNGHSYLVSVYNADETVLKGSVAQSGDDIWGIAKTFSTDNIYLAEGEYRLIIQNTTPNSNGRIVSISASYEGGAVVNIPNNDIPFADAILNGGATRNLVNDPHEIHFGSVSANAQWNVHATAGLYTFTFDVVGTNYGIYKLDILDGSETIFTQEKGQDKVGQVTISNAFIPADGDYVLQLANINSGADGYLTSLAATAATNIFVLDENMEDDGSIAAAAGNTYTFLLKRSFEADRYYTICIPVGSWNDELKLAFGDDYELWKMTSATQSGDEISLNFEQCNTESFHAGWPYLIKPSVAVQNPIFYNKKEIKNSTYNNTQSFDAADIIGTFYKSEIPAGVNNLYLQDNDLYYSQSNDTPIKGTRAWIRIKPAGAAGVRARIVLGGQSATAIDLVNGELVNGTVKTIEDGQLVIIRDGVRYNVMGIRFQ